MYCHPREQLAGSLAVCRAKFVRSFGLKAFRQPLSEDEFHRYETLFSREAAAQHDFLKGATIVVEGMLQSPKFLFRIENGTDAACRSYETASKLSYFIWDSMPDAALLRAAASGELNTPAGFERVARRMLADPRAHRSVDEYVSEWLNGTAAIEEATKAACPELAGTKFMAPSFAGVARNDYFTLDPVEAFRQGLDERKNIGLIASHNYMGVSTNPGITLQGTLMNHSSVIDKANAQLDVSRGIKELGEALDPSVPFIMGEHNSLARQGRPGLSNSFGAALWGVDWNVYLASQNLSRSHMHQGTNYRYVFLLLVASFLN